MDRRGGVQRADEILTETSRQFEGQLDREFAQEAMYSFQGGAMAKGRPWAVYGLILANAGMFAAELAMGGAENEDALFKLGALFGPAVTGGQWWRVVTANFLHFGWLHIGMNMLALYAIGRGLERRLGSLRFLVVYLVSGIGALCGVVEIERWRQIEPEILVGASACVMGLIGAMLGMISVGWLRHRTKGASRQFKGLLWVVILQVCFDWSFPQVSSLAHMLGMGIGFVVTAILVAMEKGAGNRSL
jgi:rhomboid protease GluP